MPTFSPQILLLNCSHHLSYFEHIFSEYSLYDAVLLRLLHSEFMPVLPAAFSSLVYKFLDCFLNCVITFDTLLLGFPFLPHLNSYNNTFHLRMQTVFFFTFFLCFGIEIPSHVF